MYAKAVQVNGTLLVFAYEVPSGGYAMAFCPLGYQPILENEPEFMTLNELETSMKDIAPLEEWSETLFVKVVYPAKPKHKKSKKTKIYH